jgi:hypothetical protein
LQHLAYLEIIDNSTKPGKNQRNKGIVCPLSVNFLSTLDSDSYLLKKIERKKINYNNNRINIAVTQNLERTKGMLVEVAMILA